jgi:hypothetical protein
MTVPEFVDWIAFYRIEQREQQAAQDAAQR